jgi:hypothetical protein
MRNKENLEEAGLKYVENRYYKNTDCESFITGAKSDVARDYWFNIFQQEQDKKMYSEEELELLIYNVCGTVARLQGITLNGNNIKAAFEQFKK